ncbi:MAG TPA: malate synthase A [Rhodanobacteraceae bacterium]|nr:malate synthase A [Rhodanobacteraceae bacterium]
MAASILPASSSPRPANAEDASAEILTDAARAFLTGLHDRFEGRRQALLQARVERQARLDAGGLPDFASETATIRESDWKVAPIPAALRDRRVEITGPVDRKMIINALNSGAKVFMADFEDSTSPTLENLVDGQRNLRDAVEGTISFTSPEGKHYEVKPDPAVLMVRPRGWHLPEKHFVVEGEPISGALFDLGLFAFHNARSLEARDRGPYFYLPKLESHREAALWNDVLDHIESVLDLSPGAIKVTVLIETLPAVFEMDEILWALKTRITGLNCGRWDYIFSYIKTLRGHRDRVLPERGQVAMTVPFLKAYSELLIKTCHRRGAFAMGGMAAQIPISNDPAANEAALEKVRADKLREVKAGHDGTWVAHPALVAVAREVFDAHMPAPNQLDRLREDVVATRDALIAPCEGTITRAGFEGNVEVCLRYLAAWLDGQGCVPIHHLMEDAATAEISRAQLWQWLHAGGLRFDGNGAPIDFALFDATLATVRQRLSATPMPGQSRVARATELLSELTHARELADFLTLAAYPELP